MKRKIQVFVPPALALFFGLYLLSRFYQDQIGFRLFNQAGNDPTASHSLPEAGQADQSSALRMAWQADSSPPVSPFRFSMAANAGPNAESQARRAAVKRPDLILKGTVGDQAATLSDASGRKIIVRVGDFWDSLQVMRIGPGKVTLRDRHGNFDILSKE